MELRSSDNADFSKADPVPRMWSGAFMFRVLTYLAAAASVVFSLAGFWQAFHLPLLEGTGFRQTQTALAVYWMLHGAGWLAYELPVLGSPWPVPLEFPIYQWIVAAVASVAPAYIDPIGRVVSYLFHLLCLIPLYSLFRRFQPGREAFLVAMSLFLAAPVYVFWSRTFMIESTALFFALAFVALYSRWLENQERWAGTAACLMGMAGILQKVTTFLPFLLVAGLLSVPPALRLVRTRQWKELGIRSTSALLIAGLPVLALLWWVGYSDAVKALHPIADYLTSEHLSKVHWIFGTLEQRLGNDLWIRVIADRAVPEAIGGSIVLWIGLGMAALLPWRAQLSVLVLGAAYLASFLIFPSLHKFHGYYQTANAVFLVALVSMIIAETAKSRPLAAGLLVALALAMLWQTYRDPDRPQIQIKDDFAQSRTLQLSNFIRAHTPENSSILVLGYDWSPEVAYYSNRKSLTLPNWAKVDIARRVLDSPSSFTRPLRVSAVVVCWDRMGPQQKDLAEKALPRLSVRRTEKIAGCDVLLTQPGS